MRSSSTYVTASSASVETKSSSVTCRFLSAATFGGSCSPEPDASQTLTRFTALTSTPWIPCPLNTRATNLPRTPSLAAIPIAAFWK